MHPPSDAPINVGWGSKQTQFHGSLGKAAAQTATNLDNVGSSPDDDEIPRISWRGDGAYFVVSALSSRNPQGGLRRRILRVYNRDATLQSTSEAVAGLEHTLSWRPSGNLIVSTQRFGFEGGGAGKDGRHDVVFFERNGLRHGEFNLREPWIKTTLAGRIDWGYSVKEVAWSPDSNILSVWIRGQERDVGPLCVSPLPFFGLTPWQFNYGPLVTITGEWLRTRNRTASITSTGI
jgi:elongator complex protein 1